MHIVPIVLAVVIAQVVGFIWYGVLFGKKWEVVVGVTEEQKKMPRGGKTMMAIHGTNLLLSVVLYVALSIIIGSFDAINAVQAMWVAILVWLGVIVPMQGQMALYSNKTKHLGWSMFLINISYQLILSIIAGLLIGVWM